MQLSIWLHVYVLSCCLHYSDLTSTQPYCYWVSRVVAYKGSRDNFFCFDFRSPFFLASSLSSLHGYTLNFWSTESLLPLLNCKISFTYHNCWYWYQARWIQLVMYQSDVLNNKFRPLFITLYLAPTEPTDRKIKFLNWAY